MPLVSCARHIDWVLHVQWGVKECLVKLSRFSWHGGRHHRTYWSEFTSSVPRYTCVGSFKYKFPDILSSLQMPKTQKYCSASCGNNFVVMGD